MAIHRVLTSLNKTPQVEHPFEAAVFAGGERLTRHHLSKQERLPPPVAKTRVNKPFRQLFVIFWLQLCISSSSTMQSRHKDNCVSRLKLILFLPFKFPIGIINQDKNSRSSAIPSISFSCVHPTSLDTTYTEPSRINMSTLGSFMRFSQSHCMRYATFEGSPFASVAGREILCFLWFEKSNSSPPLRYLLRNENGEV